VREGLLWLDADPKRDLADKVARAADRYHKKFGHQPDLCFVNPSMLSNGSGPRPAHRDWLELNGVRLLPADNVLKHHFWIGVEETTSLPEAA
jgi:hypothetical protein